MKVTLNRLMPLLALAISAPAMAAEIGTYACASVSASVLDITNDQITTDKNIRQVEIKISEALEHDKVCIPGVTENLNYGYIGAYCSARYQATALGLGAPITFYGNETTNFHGFTPMDYLVVFDDGFTMSFKLGPAIFVHVGDCKRL
jgi:hypothetical protein